MNRRHVFIIVLMAVAIVGVVLLLVTRSGPIVELLGSDAIVELRDQLRPLRPDAPRVLLIAIDGVGDGEFRAALAEGRMPRIQALFGTEANRPELFQHAYLAAGALSILPSTTYAAWTSVFSGEPVAVSGVPGNEWFDRETLAFVAPAPVSISGFADAARVYTDDLIGQWMAVPTLFERADVRSYAVLVAQHRGADLLVKPDVGMLGDLMAALAAGVDPDSEADRDKYRALDDQALEGALAAVEEYGLPDLLAVYLPGADLYTHVAEPALPEQIDYMSDIVDPAVGRLLDAYGTELANTFVVLVADHGHTPTLDTDRHALGTGDDHEPPAILERAGFRVRPFEQEVDGSDFQAVFAYQGAMAYLYLADRSTCPDEGTDCDWLRPPRFEEDVLAAVRAIDHVNRTGEGFPNLRGTIDLIFARRPRGLESAEPFMIWTGEELVSIGAYLEMHPRPDLVDLEARMDDLAAGPLGHRVGDVLLLSRSRFEDPIEQRFYFATKYRSWHGSPSAQDSEILWAVAHPRLAGEELKARVQQATGTLPPSQLDITRVVLDLLNAYSGPR